MQIIRPDTNFDFMGKFGLFFGLSTFAVLASIILVFFPGLNYGIEFRGGTQMQLQFGSGIDTARIRGALAKAGYTDTDVVQFGSSQAREFLITVPQKSSMVSEKVQNQAKRALGQTFAQQGFLEDSFRLSSSGDRLQLRFTQDVDPAQLEQVLKGAGFRVREHREGEHTGIPQERPGGEAQQASAEEQTCDAPICRLLPMNEYKYEVDLIGVQDLVVAGLQQNLGARNVSEPSRVIYVGPKVGEELTWSAIMSLVYAIGFIMLYVAFRFDMRFAPGGVIALIHDALITCGFFVVLQQQFSLPIVAALLTIVGYSINDTVVVYDRIRENFQKHKERDLSMVINQSINETLSRTIITSLATLFSVLAIFFLGNGVIRDFAFALSIGIMVGTYSSIFIAAPITVYLDRHFFSKKAASASA